MNVAECAVEFICHIRWLAHQAMTMLDEPYHGQYRVALALAAEALRSVSASMAHVEGMHDVPLPCVTLACDGTLYLLVAELFLAAVRLPCTLSCGNKPSAVDGTRRKRSLLLLDGSVR